jgi:hypothetical protein
MLVHAARTFSCEIVPSELQALVREDELIKLYRPPFNVRQNDYLEYVYLERTNDPFPRFRLVDHATELGERAIYGPYRDRHATERLLVLVQRLYGVRSCTTPEPVGHCLELDLGHCPGPCRGNVTAQAYAAGIAGAEAFLRGESSGAESRLREAMEAAAGRLEFEKAQELKEQLLFCRRFRERERFLTAFREGMLTVVEGGRTHRFLRGQRFDVSIPTGAEGPETGVCGGGSPDLRFVHDRASVVYGWLRRNRDRCRYWFEEIDASIQDSSRHRVSVPGRSRPDHLVPPSGQDRRRP